MLALAALALAKYNSARPAKCGLGLGAYHVCELHMSCEYECECECECECEL